VVIWKRGPRSEIPRGTGGDTLGQAFTFQAKDERRTVEKSLSKIREKETTPKGGMNRGKSTLKYRERFEKLRVLLFLLVVATLLGGSRRVKEKRVVTGCQTS